MFSWLFLLSIAVLTLAAVQYMTIRQLGVMLSRLEPLGARSTPSQGPREGEYIAVQMAAIRHQLDRPDGDVLYLFGSRSCSVCSEVLAAAERLHRQWHRRVQIAFIYDEPPPAELNGPRSRVSPPGVRLAYDGAELRESLRIGSVPFGVRVDRGDLVLAKGLVNATSHVESLLEVGSHQAAALADSTSGNAQRQTHEAFNEIAAPERVGTNHAI
jgi:hypothetical protein